MFINFSLLNPTPCTPGIQIKDPNTAKYFIDYYQNLWSNSEILSEELLNNIENQMNRQDSRMNQ